MTWKFTDLLRTPELYTMDRFSLAKVRDGICPRCGKDLEEISVEELENLLWKHCRPCNLLFVDKIK